MAGVASYAHGHNNGTNVTEVPNHFMIELKPIPHQETDT